MLEEKFEKLLDLYSFAVEEVVRLVKTIYTFSLQPSFSERELIGLVPSYGANYIDPKNNTKKAMWITVSVPTIVSKPHQWY
jgi:hypothetical protein